MIWIRSDGSSLENLAEYSTRERGERQRLHPWVKDGVLAKARLKSLRVTLEESVYTEWVTRQMSSKEKEKLEDKLKGSVEDLHTALQSIKPESLPPFHSSQIAEQLKKVRKFVKSGVVKPPSSGGGKRAPSKTSTPGSTPNSAIAKTGASAKVESKSTPCCQFQKGSCSYGDTCRFQHVAPSLAAKGEQKASTGPQKAPCRP